ncbi:MAG: aminoacyl-tRNA hydrolase [Marinilabiliales bacterium]|nr:MAG: aminoacyl-tRNA hydrolase [Marinilabiliales bacterium]
MEPERFNLLKNELSFRTSRSGGPGGQNVNKVSTKVELLFYVEESLVLNDDEKTILMDKLANRISIDGILTISSSETRSQFKNKQIVIEKFRELITEALKPQKIRRKTKVPKGVKEKRLKTKKIIAEKKDLRKPPKV